MDSDFNITGKLVMPVDLDKEVMSCSKKTKNILLAVRRSTVMEADKLCNKLMMGSLGPYIPDMQTYWEMYGHLKQLPNMGFKDRCWHGGRVLLYIPYVMKAGQAKYHHYKDSSIFTLDQSNRNTIVSHKNSSADRVIRWYSGPISE